MIFASFLAVLDLPGSSTGSTTGSSASNGFHRGLGLSSANLCDLEQGQRIPSPARVRGIARKLGLLEKGPVAIALEDAIEKQGLRYSVELKDVA